MAVLAIGGMLHIDHRRREILGSSWGPVALTTSAVPFLAATQGRSRIDWAGIGLWRVAGGLALYLVLLLAHEPTVGVGGLAGWRKPRGGTGEPFASPLDRPWARVNIEGVGPVFQMG